MDPLIILIISGFISGIFLNFFGFGEKLKKYLSRYLIYFGLPLFIFVSLVKNPIERFLIYGLIAFVSYLLLNIILFLLIKLFPWPPQKKASLLACTVFGNTGYIGFPLVYLFFKDIGILIWTTATLIIGFLHYSLGILLPNLYVGSKKSALLKAFKTPLIYSFSLAVILSRFPIIIPKFIESFSFSALYLAPLIIGFGLAFKKFDRTLIPGFLLKFMVSPALFLFILALIPGLSWTEKGVFLLLAATPPPLIATSFAIEYKWDSVYAANLTSLATIFFLVIAFLVYFLVIF